MVHRAKKAVADVVARPARTAGQGGVAWAILEVVDSTFWDMPERAYGGLLVLLTWVIGTIQTATENRLGKAILRDIPEPNVNPIENAGPA